MDYSEAIIKGLLLGLLMAISVGPTLFAIIRYSMHHSYKAGLAFILGVNFSDVIYVALANLATNWLNFLEEHQKIVGYCGSVFFIIMGLVGLLRKHQSQHPKQGNDMVNISASAYLRLWSTGFLMNALNPAVILLWVGSAISVAGSVWQSRIVFYAVCLGIVLSFDILKVLMSDKIRRQLTLRRVLYLNRISAALVLIFGFLLMATVYYNIRLEH
jgi:threonine/homoserine/homoserine lactone efflux protein